jgi:hypothetical protein
MDITLSGGGVWSWNSVTSDLTFDASASILVPETAYTNSILPTTWNLPVKDGVKGEYIVYVDIDDVDKLVNNVMKKNHDGTDRCIIVYEKMTTTEFIESMNEEEEVEDDELWI